MPEMPDLEIFSHNIGKRFAKQRIRSAQYLKEKRLNVTKEKFASTLVDKVLTTARREGKEVYLDLDDGNQVSIHLMLSGGFSIDTAPSNVKFKCLSIIFENGLELSAFDPRGLLTVTLNPKPSTVPDVSSIDVEYLESQIKRQPNTLAKLFLIDQTVVRGIGNAYADEILWHARISPKSLVGKLPGPVVARLVESTNSVLKGSVEALRERTPEALSGEDRGFLSVHVKDRPLSPTGFAILNETIGSKSTYYTEEQQLYA